MKITSIVVPCYNEEKRLSPEKFEKFALQNKHIRLVFVNDASTDKTLGIIEALCKRIPESTHCVNLGCNSGKAEAVRAGILFALNEGSGYIGYWDADLSTPLYETGNLLPLFHDPAINIVMASRVQMLGRKIARKKTRHYAGRVFATLASMILDLKVYDTQCGAKIFRVNKTLKAAFSLPFRVKWTFDVEILARYAILGRACEGQNPVDNTIIEYPLKEWRDVPGSKVKVKDAFIAILELYRIYSFVYSPGAFNMRKALLDKYE